MTEGTEATQTEASSEPTEAKTLLDMGEVSPADSKSETTPEKTETPPPSDWHWTDGLKGEGDKPDWLKERYKSVSDQAQAYGELEKKFGEFKGAPKDGYSFDGIEGLDKDSPLLKHFSEAFKDLNLSQEGFNKIASDFVSLNLNAAEVDLEAELKKLGPQGKQMIGQSEQWAKNNLPAEIADVALSWLQTAEDIKAFDLLRSFQPLSKAPSSTDMSTSVTYESAQAVKNEKAKNWTRYKEDVNYRESVIHRLNAAVRRESAQKR